MSRDTLEAALHATADDLNLSRGERTAFKQLLKDAAPDRHELAYLRKAAFKLAGERLGVGQNQQVMGWLEDTIKLLIPRAQEPSDLESHFSPGEDCRRRIRSALDGARAQLDICVFTITDNGISEAIEAAHGRGVRVRIITDNDKSEDLGSDVDRLERVGVQIRTDRTEFHMHHKFAIFDRRTLITGSYNWTRSAFRNNQENIVVSTDARLIGGFAGEFERLWKRFA